MKKMISSLMIAGFFCLLNFNIKAQTSHASDAANLSKRPFQISFIPYFGTNGSQSPNIINNFSLNILSGYNGGTTGFELGSLVNIDRYDVTATQIAGIGNLNGESTKGVQLAGIFNLTQIMDGTQVAGITNFALDAHGVQLAGITNYNNSGSTAQIGGLVNVTTDHSLVQVAGLLNHAASCSGPQIAGLVNTSTGKTGSQVAGILNVAKSVKGVQIGLVNIADSISGVPVGLINIIRHGYHRFELSADELFQANVAFRSGVERFHVNLNAGIQPRHFDSPLWTFGAGIGTSQALSPKMLLDIDASTNQILKKGHIDDNTLYKIYLGIDRSLSSHVSLVLGITYNFLATDIRSNRYEEYYSDIAPYSFSDQSYSHFNLKSWAGFKVGLRFR